MSSYYFIKKCSCVTHAVTAISKTLVTKTKISKYSVLVSFILWLYGFSDVFYVGIVASLSFTIIPSLFGFFLFTFLFSTSPYTT